MGPRLELIDQEFATDPNGDFRLRYVLTGLDGDPLQLVPASPTPPPTPPPTPAPPVTDPAAPPQGGEPVADPAAPEPVAPVDPPPELPALTIEVTNYRPLTDPGDVSRLVGSTVDPNAFTDVVAGVAIDARPLVSVGDDGTVGLTLDIGTDVVDSIETRLKMDTPGMYPLRVQLLVGDPA
ncbi:MAG TPA: hypothetical protein VLN74_05645, partial [Ilumatobacteraceae bacterium]|nr:hypothetical protein [Ilumatobacteraceae bacterium]